MTRRRDGCQRSSRDEVVLVKDFSSACWMVIGPTEDGDGGVVPGEIPLNDLWSVDVGADTEVLVIGVKDEAGREVY